MKKRIIGFLVMVMILLSLLVGCGRKGYAYIFNGAGLNSIPGMKYLYWDEDTYVVYRIFSEYSGDQGYGYMSPYYAPNGFPYTYDPSTKELVEIER